MRNYKSLLVIIPALIGLMISCQKTEKRYYESGELKLVAEINSDSLWDGEVKQYYKNGELQFQGSYLNGRKYGLASYFSEDGKLLQTEFYVNDVLDGLVCFYDSLSYKYFEYDFVKGDKAGYRRYDSLGNVINRFVYLDTLNLPTISDVQFLFDTDTNNFHAKDTIHAEIRIPELSGNQISIAGTNSMCIIESMPDFFQVDIIPSRAGEMKLFISIWVDDEKRVFIGHRDFVILE